MSNHTQQSPISPLPARKATASSECDKVLWDEKVKKDLASFRRQSLKAIQQ